MAALANGTMGYACDVEPHHPEAILHPIAVMIPTALAMAERELRPGADLIGAVALGCEVEYRVSMALGPAELGVLTRVAGGALVFGTGLWFLELRRGLGNLGAGLARASGFDRGA